MTNGLRVLVLLAVLAGAGAAQDEVPRPVSTVVSVEVRGNERVGTDYVLTQLRTEAGKPYDPKTIDEDIRRLAGLGFFSNIEVEQLRTPEGDYRIVFVVEEEQLVQRVEILGVDELDLDDIRPLVKIRTGQPLVRYLIHLDRERIRNKYLEEGYLFVDVQVTVRETLSGTEVVFDVQEGPEVEVGEIRFVGNHSIDEDDLEDQMQTEESWLLSSEEFREDVLREDLVTLKTFYRSKGFFDVEVELQDIRFSSDLEEMDLVLFVEEGPRYRVDRIEIRGVDLFSQEELVERFRQKTGEYFDQADILHDKNKVQEIYQQNAFLDAGVGIDFFYAAEGHEVSLVYTVTEGRPYRVARVDVTGNLYTRDDVVRRYIEQLPWQYANVIRMRNSVRNLQRTGWFNTVNLRIEDGRNPGEKDVVYAIEEGDPSSFRLAAGVSSNVGFIGDVTLQLENFDIADLPKGWDDLFGGGAFTGGGQSLILQFQPGTELFRFRAGFVEPYIFGYPYSLSINAQHFTRNRESYDEVRLGGDVSLGHRFDFDRHLTGSLSYRNEVVELDDVDADAPSFVRRSEGRTSIASFTLGWDYDRRDDDILPTRGYRLHQTTEVASDVFGGDENFFKVDLRGEWYTTVYRTDEGNPHVIGLFGRAGYGDAFGDSDEIPIFERYFAGGFGSLRGFDFRGVGPMEAGDPIGGEVLALASIEYSFPIFKDILRGVLFVDSGTVATDFDSSELGKWRVAAGFGFRIKIPLLGQRPFAVDFGFPLRKEDDDEEEIVSFSLGRSF